MNSLVRNLHKWHFFDALRITRKGTQLLLKEGPFTLLNTARLRFRDPLQYQFHQWLKINPVLPSEYEKMAAEAAAFSFQPLISIIMPVYNVDPVWLQKCIDSVIGQIYPNWELCIADDGSSRPDTLNLLRYFDTVYDRIKICYMEQNEGIAGATNQALEMATGEFIGLLDSDDELAPEALFEVVKLLNEDPHVDFIYSDEDKLSIGGRRCEPFFKPDWSPDLLYSHMYTCHFGVYRTAIARQIGGFKKEFEGSQDYDFVLRFIERTGKIRHIPKILYHWRKIPGSGADRYDAKNTDNVSFDALKEAVTRTGGGTVEKGLRLGTFRVRRTIAGEPLVSIIMPCRDRSDLSKQCIDSIREKSTWSRYEILVVDNNSRENATLSYLEQLRNQQGCRVFSFDGPYNFSAINNMASREAAGDVLVFVNNDIEVITADWLEVMLELCQQPDVGAVGPMLLYPDNTIQHAGVILGVGGISNHAFYRTDPGAYSYFNQANVIRNYSALTGACLMVRKEVYEKMGGLDETNCPIDYNDIDFCLRLWEKGYRVVYTPFATLYHHEGATLGRRENPEYKSTKARLGRLFHHQDNPGSRQVLDPEAAFMQAKWGKQIADDPFYNPNLARHMFDFSLRLRD